MPASNLIDALALVYRALHDEADISGDIIVYLPAEAFARLHYLTRELEITPWKAPPKTWEEYHARVKEAAKGPKPLFVRYAGIEYRNAEDHAAWGRREGT